MLFIKNIVVFLASFAVGSIVGVYFNNVYIAVFALAILSLYFIAVSSFRKLQTTLIVSLSLLIFSSGYFYGVSYSSINTIPKNIEDKIDKYAQIEGNIVSNPEFKNGKQIFILKDGGIKFQTSLQKYPVYKYGDRIEVYGKISRPENFKITNDKEVRYEALLRARGIQLIIDGKRSDYISRNNGNLIISKLYDFKNHIGDMISRIESPESGLLFSMVFGGKNNLDKDIVDYFRIAGLLHIVVLSGQNLTIVALLATKIFSYTYGFRVGHILALLIILAYAIIGGLEAATMRAVFMSSILILLLMFGKVANAGRALFVSVLVMTILNPYIVFDDPSFQLSVLAFSGIIYISPIIQNWLLRKNVSPKFVDYLSAIFGAQIAVLPFILYSSQTLTPYSFLANFLALFAVGAITVYGIFSVLIGLISPLLFSIISFPLIFALKYIIGIASLISTLPYASININVNYYFVLIVYVISIVYLIKRWRKEDLMPINQFVLRKEVEALRNGRIPREE